MMTWEEFLLWEQASQDTIDVKRAYVDLAGDLVAGVLLSQIIFWHLPGKEKDTKLRVIKKGKLWLAKGRNDWWEECRITAKQFDRAAEILEKVGVVEKARFRFDGSPTVHVRLITDKFMTLVNSILTKGKNPTSPKVKMELDQRGRSITEITTKSTTESTDLVGQNDPPVNPSNSTPPYKQIVELYHSICTSLPTIRDLNDSRKQAIRNRWKRNPDIKFFIELFKRVEKSDFLSGRKKAWRANFDWIMKQQNFCKILEGNYDNRVVPEDGPPEPVSPAHILFEPSRRQVDDDDPSSFPEG